MIATQEDLRDYVLGLADDALILSHRITEWVTRAPVLEEDVALANIGLDLLGQARLLLGHAGELEGQGRTEDDLAYLRDEREFRNVILVEQDNGDFAETMARLLVFSAYQSQLYERLSASADQTLAAVAAKAVKEVAYHRDHASRWVLRLGDGTAESHERMRSGLERIWPYVDELFETGDGIRRLAADGIAVDASACRADWESGVAEVLRQAGLARPAEPAFRASGGRRGVHSEALGYLLAEMQHLARSHPGATW